MAGKYRKRWFWNLSYIDGPTIFGVSLGLFTIWWWGETPTYPERVRKFMFSWNQD